MKTLIIFLLLRRKPLSFSFLSIQFSTWRWVSRLSTVLSLNAAYRSAAAFHLCCWCATDLHWNERFEEPFGLHTVFMSCCCTNHWLWGLTVFLSFPISRQLTFISLHNSIQIKAVVQVFWSGVLWVQYYPLL